MTVQQEAHKKINQMSEDGVRQLLLWINNTNNSDLWIREHKEHEKDSESIEVNPAVSEDAVIPIVEENRKERMKKFLATAGKVKLDAQAIYDLRERSMI